MAALSSYLRYLPPILWQDEPAPPEFSLGTVLRIFEKVLTGIDDGVTVGHGDHTHPAITDLVDRQYQLFDPWRTPPQFLPWLASWVGLDFPTLQGQQLWDEYQQRKATAEIAGIDRLRGLRAGLNQYLDLFTVGQARPRVTIDDGRRLLVTRPLPNQLAPLAALVTQGPVLSGGLAAGPVISEGLIRPWCVTPAPDGSLFVGDIGVPSTVSLPLKSRVWRISATGGYDLTGTPPRPQPLVSDTLQFQVVALAVRPAGSGLPENLYIMDRSGKLYALPAPYVGQSASLVTSVAVGGNTTIWPVAMVVDTNGDLLVLDRGDGPGTSNPPKIITVKLNPLSVTRKNLTTVLEPLSLIVQPDGKLIIGDGGNQAPTTAAQLTGNLVQVNRSGANWVETALLPVANPLTAPTGITSAADGTKLYVLDAGLKPFAPPNVDPFILSVAKPAAVYAVDLAASPVTISAVTESGDLTFPTGLAAAGGRLVICDPGQPEVGTLVPVWSRLLPCRFDVVVHFVESQLPTDPDQRATVQRQVVGNVRAIVERQKPAHNLWKLVTVI